MQALLFVQTTHDVTDICSAEFLSEVGRKTPLIARFSTVVHESGSPESLRDTRGFSVKFYTNEGNWDFVGNNMPVSLLFKLYCFSVLPQYMIFAFALECATATLISFHSHVKLFSCMSALLHTLRISIWS